MASCEPRGERWMEWAARICTGTGLYTSTGMQGHAWACSRPNVRVSIDQLSGRQLASAWVCWWRPPLLCGPELSVSVAVGTPLQSDSVAVWSVVAADSRSSRDRRSGVNRRSGVSDADMHDAMGFGRPPGRLGFIFRTGTSNRRPATAPNRYRSGAVWSGGPICEGRHTGSSSDGTLEHLSLELGVSVRLAEGGMLGPGPDPSRTQFSDRFSLAFPPAAKSTSYARRTTTTSSYGRTTLSAARRRAAGGASQPASKSARAPDRYRAESCGAPGSRNVHACADAVQTDGHHGLPASVHYWWSRRASRARTRLHTARATPIQKPTGSIAGQPRQRLARRSTGHMRMLPLPPRGGCCCKPAGHARPPPGGYATCMREVGRARQAGGAREQACAHRPS
nr:unnamed protein product [Digitaria exilis]